MKLLFFSWLNSDGDKVDTDVLTDAVAQAGTQKSPCHILHMLDLSSTSVCVRVKKFLKGEYFCAE